MTLLQRVLKVQAALWALFGILGLAIPAALTDRLFGADAGVDALTRLLGVAALVLAMLMVLVSQHAIETWWWAWAFALLEAGVATVCILHAAVGTSESVSAMPWWTLGVVSLVFGGLDLVALARAEQTKPFV